MMTENEQLRSLLRRYRTETPLGHQPHMIAHEVDALLACPSLQGGAEPGDWTDEQAFELARHMCVAHGGDPDAPIYQGHGQVGENWQVYLPMATEALIFCRGVKP